MARTYAEIITLAQSIVIDNGIDPSGVANQIFAAAEFDKFVPMALEEVSTFRPHQVKETLLTTADSRELTLAAENKRKLLYIYKAEYEVDKNPRVFHNVTRFGDVVTLEMDIGPVDDESVYLYMGKVHLLQKEIGTTDTALAVKTTAAIGATSLILKSAGTGTVNEDTTFTITGDATATVYTVTATATIAATEVTVSIAPALKAQATADDVVTLAISVSTMDDVITEDLLADLLAGRAAINKSRLYIGGTSMSGANTAANMLSWGQNKVAETRARLSRHALSIPYVEYSREL
jgi:hypothetical protein